MSDISKEGDDFFVRVRELKKIGLLNFLIFGLPLFDRLKRSVLTHLVVRSEQAYTNEMRRELYFIATLVFTFAQSALSAPAVGLADGTACGGSGQSSCNDCSSDYVCGGCWGGPGSSAGYHCGHCTGKECGKEIFKSSLNVNSVIAVPLKK